MSMSTTPKVQLEFEFEPGLTVRYPELRDLVAAIVYNARGGLKEMAGEIGVSVSHLSRALSHNDPDDRRYFDVDWVSVVIQSTGDTRPISWLIEKFMTPPETRRNQVIEEVARLLPHLTQLVAQEVGSAAGKPWVRPAVPAAA